jgi:antirestriction protein ArdC
MPAPKFATKPYSPSSDHIQMPQFQAFEELGAYYATLAHEHTHWTAKADRCDRQLGKRFGDNAYAVEELIAELGAAFTCAHLGLGTEPRADHATYIQSWLKVLKSDKRAIVTAASKAQQACDWLVRRAESGVTAQQVAA